MKHEVAPCYYLVLGDVVIGAGMDTGMGNGKGESGAEEHKDQEATYVLQNLRMVVAK